MCSQKPFEGLEDIVQAVGPIGERFRDAGYRLYLVGGIVRDLYLNLDLGAEVDIDMTTDAKPDVTRDLVASMADAIWTQGQRFGTIGMNYQKWSIEITTHRAESYTQDSRKPVVSFGTDIDLDLSRRDFTVNAMAISVPEGELVDPYGGRSDLLAGRLVTPIAAEVSFSDDPLRMMRAARFVAKYDLAACEEVVEAATVLAGRIEIVAIERIGDEWRKFLSLPDPSAGVTFLADTGVLGYVLPGVKRPWPDSLAQLVSETLPDWRLRLATLLALVFVPPGAPVAQQSAAADALSSLRLSNAEKAHIKQLWRLADLVLSFVGEESDALLRRFIYACQTRPSCLHVLSLAQSLAKDTDSGAALQGFVERLDVFEAAESFERPEFLDGEAIMSALGRKGGPWVGEAQSALLEHYFAHGPSSLAEQIDFLQNDFR